MPTGRIVGPIVGKLIGGIVDSLASGSSSPPSLLSLSIDATGLELTATYDGAVADAEAITLTETNGNAAPTATYASGEGTDTIVYDLSRAALASEAFTATGDTFSDEPVDNGSLATQLDLVTSSNRLFAWDFTDAKSLTLDGADIDAVADYWGLINGAATVGAEPQYDALEGAQLNGAERIVAASGFSSNLGADGYWLAISFAENTASNTGTRVLVSDSGSSNAPYIRSNTYPTGRAALGQDGSNVRRHVPTEPGATVGGWKTLLMKIALTGDMRTAPVGAIAPLAFGSETTGSPSLGTVTVTPIMGTSPSSTFGWFGAVRRMGAIKGGASEADLLAFARWVSGGGDIVAPVLPMLTDSAAALTCGVEIGSATVYWFTVYKASDFPEWPTAKDYFALWSTDHDAGSGSIRWGDMDLLDLSDFEEQGTLYSAYQGETPWLLRVPEDPDGRVLYLFYHTDQDDPRNGTSQITHLRTSADGSSWTDVNDPLNLNTGGGENHTGYFSVVRLGSGDYIGWHQSNGGGDGYRSVSRATDPRDWTRDSAFDDEQNMPLGYASAGPRRLSSGDWGIGLFADVGSFAGNQSKGLAAIRVSGEERALSRFGQQINTWAVTDATTYTEAGVVYVYYVKTQTTVHVATYDVADLPA